MSFLSIFTYILKYIVYTSLKKGMKRKSKLIN